MNRVGGEITTIFFDWDGTLMDSARMGLIAFQGMFGDLGIEFSQETYQDIYSPNWYSMYEALGLPRDKWETADDLWIRHYGQEPPSLVEGALDTILELHAKGYLLGVVSSGSDRRVKREIDEVQLASVFHVVICNEDTVQKKPHPEALEKAMVRTNVRRENCSYVGDSPEDIEMGKLAGLLTVGVKSAYPGSKRLLGAGPDIYLESVSELLQHF